MVRFTFHGGAGEVGRSCVEVAGASRTVLFDCGIKLDKNGSEYPEGLKEMDPEDIAAIFISHAHLDHIGALPWLDHLGADCPIFATKTTKDLMKTMLKDAFKVGTLMHDELGYTPEDITRVLRSISRAKTEGKGDFKGLPYRFFDAGHIPGSASIHIELDGKKILYTGDIKTTDTLLLKGADTRFPETDIMVCECTYGGRDHPPRAGVDKEFLSKVHSVVDKGGSVLIPVFALGRSQEILLLLVQEKFPATIYFDGMSNETSDIVISNPSSVKDVRALERALGKVVRVRKQSQRAEALRGPSIIITTSGMLTGGPVLSYLEQVADRPDLTILLTGYQVEDTNGYSLLHRKEVEINGSVKRVAGEVLQFDFSAHAGMSELKSLIRGVSPKKVVFVHGDPSALAAMHEWADARGLESYVPKIGDSLDL